MTDREKILAEVERKIRLLKSECRNISPTTANIVIRHKISSKIAALYEILAFINSLPSEQTAERLGDEIDNFSCSDEFALAKRAGEEVTVTAQHFAQWQKEQLMKNVVETEVKGFVNGKGIYIDTCIPIGIDVNEGDKVKIIIIKEDEQ